MRRLSEFTKLGGSNLAVLDIGRSERPALYSARDLVSEIDRTIVKSPSSDSVYIHSISVQLVLTVTYVSFIFLLLGGFLFD